MTSGALLWQREPKSLHTELVFVDSGSAVLLGVFGIAEQHAFVSNRFLFLANTAWLEISLVNDTHSKR